MKEKGSNVDSPAGADGEADFARGFHVGRASTKWKEMCGRPMGSSEALQRALRDWRSEGADGDAVRARDRDALREEMRALPKGGVER